MIDPDPPPTQSMAGTELEVLCDSRPNRGTNIVGLPSPDGSQGGVWYFPVSPRRPLWLSAYVGPRSQAAAREAAGGVRERGLRLPVPGERREAQLVQGWSWGWGWLLSPEIVLLTR